MKYILFILTIVFFFSLEHNLQAQEMEGNIQFQKKSLECDFENATLFSLTETIVADFNGDGINDSAYYRKDKGTSGIIIKHGQATKEIRIGFGEYFAHLTEFNWVDFWGLVKDSTSYEILFNEIDIIADTIIKLQNPSIVLRKEEVGGGLITFIDGNYKWIHQTD